MSCLCPRCLACERLRSCQPTQFVTHHVALESQKSAPTTRARLVGSIAAVLSWSTSGLAALARVAAA